MKPKVDKFARAATIKIKINNQCINQCSYCLFNGSNDKLRLSDIDYFLNIIQGVDYYRIIINGGEPLIHPDYLAIIDNLASYRNQVRLELGTNLIPFTYHKYIRQEYLEKTINTFSRFQIGCDDEHKNIDIVERFVPILVRNNREVAINSINGFYSEKTRSRLEKLKNEFGITLYYSELAHEYKAREKRNTELSLCRFRHCELLLNSNGDGFFCYQQEFESPLFNIFKDKSSKILRAITTDEIGYPFKFCTYCAKYKPS